MITIYWLLACLALTLLEVCAFTGFATVAAIAALITAGLTYVTSITLISQISCWVVLTVVITLMFRKWLFKPERAILDDENAIAGAVGEIIKLQEDHNVALFTRPIKGQIQWPVKCHTPLKYQQRVEVIQESEDGRYLEVRPANKMPLRHAKRSGITH